MQAFITRGCITDHGGIILEAADTFIVQGKGVHLEGMKHFCPRCGVVSTAIATNKGFFIVGSQTIIVAGDRASCGATFLKQQDLAVLQSGTKSLNPFKFNAPVKAPISKSAYDLPDNAMSFSGQTEESPRKVFESRADPDGTKGVLSSTTFGLSEKVGVLKPDNPDGSAYIGGVLAGAVIGPNKAKAVAVASNAGRAGKTARLKQLATDPKLGKSDKGWLKQEINEIARGKKKHIRNPPGKDLAHERGRESSKGYSYTYSNLQDKVLHKLQHKFDNFGRKNKERPPE